ncbi:MAG: PHP domain-containing protein, partial [Candidatus Obscuribacterales bacterium]|nr:PHP domain-containing protein [Candidatus Obscuribacterales bacterium]
MRTDLHLHSSFSDGNWRPCELVEYAIDFGMDVISITDHDTIAGVEPAIAAAGDRLKVIPGIELSATLNGACDIHILGYFIDPANSELLQAIDRLAAVRIEHTQRLLHKLRASGLNISMDDVLAFSKEGCFPLLKKQEHRPSIYSVRLPGVCEEAFAYARFELQQDGR